MIFEVETLGGYGTNCYFYGDDSKEIVLVDPGAGGPSLEKTILQSKFVLKGIILTHGHPDHTGAVSYLKGKFNVPIYMSENARPRGFSVDTKLKEDDEILIGKKKLIVKESPGHTSDGIILISFEDRLIFTGDTIFNRSIGRTDLGGDYDTLMNSIRNKIMNGAGITDDFKIYPGHMSPSSVGNERKFNPFNEDFL